MTEIERKQGIVKWFNPDKGYGFITAEEDYFFHVSEITTQLEEGDEVEFTPSENERGKIAKNVLLK